MDIHFISSLTPDDEDRLATTILETLKPMLSLIPIAYTVRIKTSSNAVFQHTRAEMSGTLPERASVFDGELPS